METLVISPDFTIEDIHKIREQNYERTKDMTVAEKVAYYNNSGKEAEKEIERRRALKRKFIILSEDHNFKNIVITNRLSLPLRSAVYYEFPLVGLTEIHNRQTD